MEGSKVGEGREKEFEISNGIDKDNHSEDETDDEHENDDRRGERLESRETKTYTKI